MKQSLCDARPPGRARGRRLVRQLRPDGEGADRAPGDERSRVARLPAIDQSRVHAHRALGPRQPGPGRAVRREVGPSREVQRARDGQASANELLQGLQGLEKAERVSKSAASARDKAFGLEPEAAKRVKLFDENNKLIADLWIGKPDMSGERTVQLAGNFVRIEGSDARLLARQAPPAPRDAPALDVARRALFPLEPKERGGAGREGRRVCARVRRRAGGMPGAESRPESRGPTPRPLRGCASWSKGKDVEPAPESAPAELGPEPATTPPKPQPRKQKDWTLSSRRRAT